MNDIFNAQITVWIFTHNGQASAVRSLALHYEESQLIAFTGTLPIPTKQPTRPLSSTKTYRNTFKSLLFSPLAAVIYLLQFRHLLA